MFALLRLSEHTDVFVLEGASVQDPALERTKGAIDE